MTQQTELPFPEPLFSAKGAPVTCLGREFESDEARRAHFRDELRRLLPSLRGMEGFPEGTDDDIIRLSDPPYYTACPNPWLTDFIREWEGAKTHPDYVAPSPYAADVSEGKTGPIYMAHAYHTKVPHPAIMRYLLHYTRPGDIIFDGFAGTGMAGVAAAMCGNPKEVAALGVEGAEVGVRHAICSDLSPIATLIAATYNLPFHADRFRQRAEEILRQVDEELGWMFRTEVDGRECTLNYGIWSDIFACPHCGADINLFRETVDLDAELLHDHFACPGCGAALTKRQLTTQWQTVYDPLLRTPVRLNRKELVRVNYTDTRKKRGERDATDKDRELIQRISEMPMTGCRTCAMEKGEKTVGPMNANGVTHIHQFYTRRNYIYLSRVGELAAGDVFLQAWVTSVMQNVSSMYKFRIDRKGGILNGTMFIPSLNEELNPCMSLRTKIGVFVKTAYPTRGHGVVSLNSATSLPNLPPDSIDYIFTDPPFGANIMYSELNSIWEGWLGVHTNTQPEAIINRVQQKGLGDYASLMAGALSEYYRVLKPGHWITVEFSNTQATVWNAIQRALQAAGFLIVHVAALDKQQGSFNAVNSATAVRQDLVISCVKPSERVNAQLQSQGSADVWDLVDDLLRALEVHRREGHETAAVAERTAKILLDRVVSFYVQRGLEVPLSAQQFQRGLAERYIERDGMWFTAEQAASYDELRRSTSGLQASALIIDSEQAGILWLTHQLYQHPQTLADLRPGWMQALQGVRQGDQIPELREVLDDNFIEQADHTYRTPNVQDDVDKAAMRTRGLLRQFRHYAELAMKPRGKITEARVEALRAGFKDCYMRHDYKTIVAVAERLPETLREGDDLLAQMYDIASSKM